MCTMFTEWTLKTLQNAQIYFSTRVHYTILYMYAVFTYIQRTHTDNVLIRTLCTMRTMYTICFADMITNSPVHPGPLVITITA